MDTTANLTNILPELQLKLFDLIDDKSLFILTKACKDIRKFIFINKTLKNRYIEFNKLYLSVAKLIRNECSQRINVVICASDIPTIPQILKASPNCKHIFYHTTPDNTNCVNYVIDRKKALNSIESIVGNHKFDLRNVDTECYSGAIYYYADIADKPIWLPGNLSSNGLTCV